MGECLRACMKWQLRSCVIIIGIISCLVAIGGIFVFTIFLVQDLAAIPKSDYKWEVKGKQDEMYKNMEKQMKESFIEICNFNGTIPKEGRKKREAVAVESATLRSGREGAAPLTSASALRPLAASASLPQHWMHQEEQEWHQSHQAEKPPDEQSWRWETERLRVVRTTNVSTKTKTRDDHLRDHKYEKYTERPLFEEEDTNARQQHVTTTRNKNETADAEDGVGNEISTDADEITDDEDGTTEDEETTEYLRNLSTCGYSRVRMLGRLRQLLREEKQKVLQCLSARFHIVVVLADVVMLTLFCLMCAGSYALIAGGRRKSAALTLPWVPTTGAAILCTVPYFTLRPGTSSEYTIVGVVVACVVLLILFALFACTVCAVGRFNFYCFLLMLDPDAAMYKPKTIVDRRMIKPDVEN